MKKRYLIFTLILLMPFLALADGFDRDLQFGMQNDADVIKLQELLADEGLYSGPISGNFFSLTLKAIKKFQIREGIKPASGYFGLKTRTKANAILATSVNESKVQASTESVTPLVSVSTAPTKTENDKPNATALMIDQIVALQKQLESLLNKATTITTQTTTVPNQTPAIAQRPIPLPINQPIISEPKIMPIEFIEQPVITQKDDKEDGGIMVTYKFKVNVDSNVEITIWSDKSPKGIFKRGGVFKDNEAGFTTLIVDGVENKVDNILGKDFQASIRHSRYEQTMHYQIRVFTKDSEAIASGEYTTKPDRTVTQQSVSYSTPAPTPTPALEQVASSPKTITLWKDFSPITDKTEGQTIDVSGYKNAELQFDWHGGVLTHTCQYAYTNYDSSKSQTYYSTFLYFPSSGCSGSVIIPIASTSYLKVDAWTSSSGLLSTTLLLK